MGAISNIADLHSYIHERIREAAYVLRLLPDTDRRFLAAGSKCSWPQYVREWTAYAADAARSPRIPPTAAEISRADETLQWIAWLATQDGNAALAVWLSFGAGWRSPQICRRLQCSRETVRQKRKSGVNQMAKHFGIEIRLAA